MCFDLESLEGVTAEGRLLPPQGRRGASRETPCGCVTASVPVVTTKTGAVWQCDCVSACGHHKDRRRVAECDCVSAYGHHKDSWHLCF